MVSASFKCFSPFFLLLVIGLQTLQVDGDHVAWDPQATRVDIERPAKHNIGEGYMQPKRPDGSEGRVKSMGDMTFDFLYGNTLSDYEETEEIYAFFVTSYCTHRHSSKFFIDDYGMQKFERYLELETEEAFGMLNRTEGWPFAVCNPEGPWACVAWSNVPDYRITHELSKYIIQRGVFCNAQRKGALLHIVPQGIGNYTMNVCVGDSSECAMPSAREVPGCYNNDMHGNKIKC